MAKNFILLFTLFIIGLTLSLTALIAWPRGSHPKRNAPTIASAKILPREIPLPINYIKDAQNDIILLCIKRIGDPDFLKKAINLYQNHLGDAAPLYKAIQSALLENPSYESLLFWINYLQGNAKKEFGLKLYNHTYALWTSKRDPQKALPLTAFLSVYAPDDLQNLLQKAFIYAQKGDDIPLMCALVPVMKKWRIEPLEPSRTVAANNFFADALFLYESGRLEEAYERLELALFMNEEHEAALQLVLLLKKRSSSWSDADSPQSKWLERISIVGLEVLGHG